MSILMGMIKSFYSMPAKIIFDFKTQSDIRNWVIVDDVVMGGESNGSFHTDNEGNGVFEGEISLNNNGGFSSVKHKFEKINVKEFTKVIISLKGDGKNYQFRLKSSSSDEYSYISPFSTSGDWQEIEISLKEMYPSFRGRKLDQPNYNREFMEEITFLIGNKRNERFKLLIGKIELK